MDKLKYWLKQILILIPIIAIVIAYLYPLTQCILFIVHKVLPLFTEMTGIEKFLEQLPYAFHSVGFFSGIGKMFTCFCILQICWKTTESVSDEIERYGYPLFSYIGVLAIFGFVATWFYPVIFNWVCFASIILFYVLCPSSSGGGGRGSYSYDEDDDEPFYTQTKQSTQTPEYVRTYKFEEVRQLASGVSAIRREYVNGRRTGSGTGFSIAGKLISASPDQLIIEWGNHWQTFDAQNGSRISSVPKPRN